VENEEIGNVQSDGNIERFYSKVKFKPLDMSELPETIKVALPEENVIRVVGIRLNETGRVYDFDAGDMSFATDDPVIVEHEKDLRIGWVAKRPMRLDNSELKLRLRRIIRRAEEKDLENHSEKRALESKHWDTIQQMIEKQRLPMELFAVDYSLDLKRVTVYFESQKRVDFRQLLKDLVRDLRVKVELRQVGSRDFARMVGALGPCGEELCCSRFLGKFHSVTIRMAKEQDLSLKPTKVAGMCGRLKCCLAYEFPVYLEGRKSVPATGKCVKCKTSEGGGCSKGVVREVDVLRQLVTVQFDDGVIKRLPVADIIEETTFGSKPPRDRMVATSDREQIARDIREASGGEENELKSLEDEDPTEIGGTSLELGPEDN
jgi:cell fate regulator YaaT (PSP1 superfamily)